MFLVLRMTFPRLLDLNGFIDEENLDKLQEEKVSRWYTEHVWCVYTSH